MDMRDLRESQNVEDRRGKKVRKTFPLPPGCRNVCRPQRRRVRHFTLRSLVRIVQSLLRTGNTADEICETMMLFPELANHCKPDCDELKAMVDEWLREFEAARESVGMLDDFFNDLWPFETSNRLLRLRGEIVSRVKWLLWLLRAYSLLKSVREVIDFVNATHVMLQELRVLLDGLCKGEDNVSPDLGLGPE